MLELLERAILKVYSKFVNRLILFPNASKTAYLNEDLIVKSYALNATFHLVN